MNDNARKWIAALRSGTYTQTKNALSNSAGYCCLGVACELFMLEYPKRLSKDRNRYIDIRTGHIGVSVLPPIVQEWLGLRSKAGDYRTTKLKERSLAGHNDGGSSFDMIADIIESNPQGLFVDGDN